MDRVKARVRGGKDMWTDRVVGTLFVVLGGALGVGVLLIERVGIESTASLRMLQVLAGMVAVVYLSLGVVVWRWTRRSVGTASTLNLAQEPGSCEGARAVSENVPKRGHSKWVSIVGG